VPASAREFIDEEIRLLSQEMPVIRAWAATNQVRRRLLPAEPFTTRRMAWLARRQLTPLGIEPVTITQVCSIIRTAVAKASRCGAPWPAHPSKCIAS